MIATLVVILIVATFLLGCVAVVDDIDRCCDRALEEEQLNLIREYSGEPDWFADARDEIRDLPEVVA